MATISRMAINLAWDGQEAEAGLNKTAHLLRNTGIAALDAAQNFSKMVQDRVKSLGLNDSEIRSLSRLSELDRERALDKYEEAENLRKMSKSSQLLYEQMTRQAEEAAAAEAQAERERAASAAAEQRRLAAEAEAVQRAAKAQVEARQKQLASLTVLEKDALFAKEKERALLLSMTGEQIKEYEAKKAAAAQAVKAAEQSRADAEALQKRLASMSALDRQRFMEKQAREKMILGMSAKQQLAFEAQERAAEKARARAEAWAEMSWIKKIKESLKGAQDIKATLEMVRGLFNLLSSGPRAAGRGLGNIIKLSADLETAKISMGVLVGGFEAGSKQIDRLRGLSVDLGISLEDAAGAFKTLVVGGVGGGDAEQLLKTFGKISPLLGSGGLGQLSQGIAGMARSGVAEKGALDQLASTGLPVYDALAQRLTVITGRLHTVRDAQDQVERGAVLASTAIGAMQEAARSPQALEAAGKFANSLDGQLARLKEGALDIFRDIGDLIRAEFPVDNILASLRGAMDAIADVVREMVREFGKLNGNGNDLEGNFKNARSFMLDVMESVVKAMREIVKAFRMVVNELQGLQATKKRWSWANLLGVDLAVGADAFMAKEFHKQRLAKPAEDFGADLLAIIKKMREDVAKAKNEVSKDIHHLLPMDVPAAPKMRSRMDMFSEMRDLQDKVLQGKAFDAGAIQGITNGFLEKFGPRADAGINQRIEAGSAAAVDAIQRSNDRSGSVPIQEAIKNAVEAAKEEAKQQTEIEQKMLDALRNIRIPATVQIPV